MNATQRIEKAILRLEEASAELLRSAFTYGSAERGGWNDANHAQDVQLRARRYSAAMRGLQRANRART